MSTENLMMLAHAAAESNNQQEAYTYYTKALELDPTNADAWMGKAAAAGWLSTLANLRLQEMIATIQRGLEFVPQEKIEIANALAANLVNSVSVAVYQLAKKQLLEYPSAEAWNTGFSQHCIQVLGALEAAHKYAPSDKQIMENWITIGTDLAQGFEFYDKIDTNLRTVVHPSSDLERIVKGEIGDYAGKIRLIDPTYQPPPIVKPTPPKYLVSGQGGCLMTFAIVIVAVLVIVIRLA